MAGSASAQQGPRRGEVVLWITSGEAASALSEREARREALAAIRSAGYTGICLESQAPDGSKSFAQKEGARLLSQVVEDARRARLTAWLAWKPTLASPGTPPTHFQVAAVPEQTSRTLRLVRSDRHPANQPGEVSPASREVVSGIARDAAALAALQPDGVLLVDFGFEGLGSDVSPAAERAFSFHARRSLRKWPEDVLGPDAQQSLAAQWQPWRASVLRNAILDVKAALATPRGRSVPMILLTQGAYSEAGDRGLNWATAQALRSSRPAAARAPEETACGHLFDAIVLGTWLPAQTEAEATTAGFRPEFSAARIVADAPIEGVPRWTCLLAGEMTGDERRSRVEGRLALGAGVLVIGDRLLEAAPAASGP